MSGIRSLHLVLGSAALVSLIAAAPAAYAHHSFAMFDAKKDMTVSGTVKDFNWANPHVWLDLTVMGKDGKPQNWGFEGANLGALFRLGWTKETLKPGDKISVHMHPMRNGSNGGQLLDITLANGKALRAAG